MIFEVPALLGVVIIELTQVDSSWVMLTLVYSTCFGMLESGCS